ncbi:MAG: (Fe-S)-binding protein, partial [Candidatus Bathyarchaeia archaeon]
KPSATYPQQQDSAANLISSLFLKPKERFWLEKLPDKTERKEHIFYLGCYAIMYPHLIATAINILQKMELDFETVGGTPTCCGHPFLRSGNLEAAETFDRKRSGIFESMGAKEVIQWDPSCTQFTTNFTNQYLSTSFRYKSLEQFISENIGKITFKKTLKKTVAIHDHPPYVHSFTGLYDPRTYDYDSQRKVIGSIPGIDLVEMTHNMENALACGYEALPYGGGNKIMAHETNTKLLEEAVNSGADTLAVFWQACYHSLLPYENKYPIEIRHFIEILGDRMGIQLPKNKFKEYKLGGNIESVLENSRENLEANGFEVEAVRDLVAKYMQIGSNSPLKF